MSVDQEYELKALRTLQAGRGLAALAVVFFHSGLEIGHDGRFWMQEPYFKFFGPGELGVEFFFILSGAVIVLAHWRDIGVASSFSLYVWKRFRRIYPIYWIVLAFAVPALYLLPNFQPGVERSFLLILSSFALVHLGSLHSVLIVAWTLYHEILFYAVFSLCLINRRIGFAAMAVWLLGSLLPLFDVVQNPALVWFFSPLHLLYGAGVLVAFIVKRCPVLDWRAFLVPGAAGLCVVLVWSYGVHHRTDAISLAIGAAFTLLLLGLIELERTRRLNVWPSLSFLGDASYSIYLLHFPVLSLAFRFLLYPASKHVHAPLWIWCLLSVAIAVGAGMALHLFVETPLLRALPRFDGRRSARPLDLQPGVQPP